MSSKKRLQFEAVVRDAEQYGVKVVLLGRPVVEVTFELAGIKSGMLKARGREWVGSYREKRGVAIGNLIHRVKGPKAAVANWLVSALVDGPSEEQVVKACKLAYTCKVAR